MKTSELINFIKQYTEITVKTQVAKEMQRLLSEINKPSTKQTINTKQKSTFKNLMNMNEDNIKKPTKKILPIKTKNPIFDQILQETYQDGTYKNIPQDNNETMMFNSEMAKAWPTLKNNLAPIANMNEDNEDYGTSNVLPNMNQVIQKRKNNINEMVPEDLKGRVDPNAIPSFLQNALTKDYNIDDYNVQKLGGLPNFNREEV